MENVIFETFGNQPRCLTEIRTDIGGRSEQQDFAFARIDHDQAFAVLCDGMGGTSDGGEAGRTAVSTMRLLYSDYLGRADHESVPSFLYRTMISADEDVTKKLNGRSGTTMVAVSLSGNRLYWLSVGDSRLYIFRAGELVQATRDHNYFLRLDEMLGNSEISREIYEAEARRGDALISYIGMGGITLFDLTKTELTVQPGDMLLLSTDGLFKVLGPEAIQQILSSDLALAVKADSLMEGVSAHAEKDIQDNTTFILMQVL